MANKVTTLIDVNTQDELYPRTKASAVSDDDGNSLGNIAVCNYTTLSSSTGALEMNLKFTLLWTNAVANARWSAQTIQLDSSGYDSLLVCCINSYTSVDYPVPFLIGKNSIHYGMAVNNYGRGIYADDTQVTVVDANNTATDRCIPYKIYGVKVG